jgi:putative hemolysin
VKEPPSYTLLLTIFSAQGLLYISSFAGIVFLLILSGLVSASEAAYFSIASQDLDRFRTSANKRHKLIIELLGRPRLLLVSLIVLNTLVDVSMIALATWLVWKTSGSLPYKEWAVVFALLLCTFMIAFLGEIVPRVYGTKHSVRVAQRTVYAWKIWLEILRPFSIFLIKMNRLLENRFKKNDNQVISGELNQALELAAENTITSDGSAGFLRSIVNFGTLTVSQVMRPAHEIVAINNEINFRELIDYISKTGFARIPVYRKTIDTIIGVLYTKDLLPFIEEEGNYPWQNLVRPGFFVSESKKLSSLLKDFQEKHVHMAIAINNSRITVGVVTLEDLVQEIIGNIQEEGKSK